MCTHPVDDEAVATPLESGLRAFQDRRTLPALLLFPSLYSLNNGLARTAMPKTPNSVIPTKLLVGISILLLQGSPRRTVTTLLLFQPLTTDL